MTVSQIISQLRDYITENQQDNTRLVEHINKYYHKIYRTIVSRIWENYFSTTQLIDAVADQESYTINKPTSSTSAFTKITQVYIKRKTDTYYRPCRYIDLANTDKSLSFYLENATTREPLYWITETELYILPKFTSETTESGSNEQIKVLGIQSPVDLSTGSIESDILIPVQYHDMIVTGALVEIYRYKKQRTQMLQTLKEFDADLEEMISTLTDRIESVDNIAIPDDTLVQYGDSSSIYRVPNRWYYA